jgi:hypothetical protein
MKESGNRVDVTIKSWIGLYRHENCRVAELHQKVSGLAHAEFL